jgi:hypothetical protein
LKKKRRIHIDKNGRDFIKESYFVGGKMKIKRVYMIDGVPDEDFYEQNASDIDHLLNGEYWKISYEKDFNNSFDKSHKEKPDLSDKDIENMPF